MFKGQLNLATETNQLDDFDNQRAGNEFEDDELLLESDVEMLLQHFQQLKQQALEKNADNLSYNDSHESANWSSNNDVSDNWGDGDGDNNDDNSHDTATPHNSSNIAKKNGSG